MNRVNLIIICCVLVIGAGCGPASDVSYDTIIRDVVIYDGSGSAHFRGDVGITADRIAAVGDLSGASAGIEINADGLALAPGFIDNHSHADYNIQDHPDALALVNQGITTVVAGQDGGSIYPLKIFFRGLEKSPVAVNFASYVGHGTVRTLVMGDDFKRVATEAEVANMCVLVRREMAAGALGLSTGLEYDPGIYSATSEVIQLAKVVAQYKGRYISHVRSEDRYFWKAIDEIIEVGREAQIPVQISHIKLAMRSYWGKADYLLDRLNKARDSGVNITADIYPYTYWSSSMTVLFPHRDFEDREEAKLALTEITTPPDMLIDHFGPNPSYVGKTLEEVSERRKTDAITTLIDLIRQSEAHKNQGGSSAGVICVSMDEPDIETFMQWPHTVFCTDGGLNGGHPRGYGTYARILGDYCRERKVLTLEAAIQKMTSQAAAHVDIRERGLIKTGWYADLVLFDPETIIDRATTKKPHEISVGVKTVLVNGVVVYDAGKTTGNRPGKVVRKKK